tara:strand:+ start:89 stop:256 length:168 start_codon:yes stop_codon:yes gene_type:complete
LPSIDTIITALIALKNKPSISTGDESLQENENKLADIIIDMATITIKIDTPPIRS